MKARSVTGIPEPLSMLKTRRLVLFGPIVLGSKALEKTGWAAALVANASAQKTAASNAEARLDARTSLAACFEFMFSTLS